MHRKSCINCDWWEHLDEDGNSLIEPTCSKVDGPKFGDHVTASDTCDDFSPYSGNDNDPLVPTEH